MSYQVRDHYFKKAKKEHFLARAVYKLEQVQKKYQLLERGQRVLDLGAAPGSWMQYTARIIGPRGFLLGVDLQPIRHPFPPHVQVLTGDIFDEAFIVSRILDKAPFDVVLSDMAPKTSGIRVADAARSALLVEQALAVARRVLRKDGRFLVKIFQGAEFHELLAEVKKSFGWVKVFKPEATRKASREIYICAMRFRG